LIEPLTAEEIVVKTESILRRTSLIPPDEIIKKGCIIINVGKYEVRVNNKIINLTPKEFDLLYVLVRANGRVLSRSYLLERIWGYRYIRETRTVDVHIRRLRKKLGKTAGRRIITVAGIGYKFE
jgi:two-component system alkaline phosphatase synthesis response regulator PhoP